MSEMGGLQYPVANHRGWLVDRGKPESPPQLPDQVIRGIRGFQNLQPGRAAAFLSHQEIIPPSFGRHLWASLRTAHSKQDNACPATPRPSSPAPPRLPAHDGDVRHLREGDPLLDRQRQAKQLESEPDLLVRVIHGCLPTGPQARTDDHQAGRRPRVPRSPLCFPLDRSPLTCSAGPHYITSTSITEGCGRQQIPRSSVVQRDAALDGGRSWMINYGNRSVIPTGQ